MSDPILRLGKQRAIAVSAEIEAQLVVTAGCRPVIAMLAKARDEAADALTALAFYDVADVEGMRRLQNEIKRFDDLVGWLRALINDGVLADAEITEQDREEMLNYLAEQPDGAERALELGLVEENQNDA